MDKKTFLKGLRHSLGQLQAGERDRCLAYYSELIDDKMEAGMTEEAAIVEFGPLPVLSQQLQQDAAERGLLRQRPRALTVVLLILGSPVWLSLVIAALAVLLSVYITLWALVVSLFAAEFSLAAAGVAGLIGGFILAPESLPSALLTLGGALIAAALALFFFRPLLLLAHSLVGCVGKLCGLVRKKIHKGGVL